MKRNLLLALFIMNAALCEAQSSIFSADKNILMQYFERQEYGKAADYLKPLSDKNPDNLHHISLLGYAYYMSNQLTEASACYQYILQVDSANIMACNYLGNINLMKGDKRKALYFFCRLVDLRPGVAAYYKQLAALWSRIGNSSAATYYYRLSYYINPNDAAVVSALANGLIQQKKYAQSDSILDAALQKDSLQEEVLETRIHSAYLQNKYKSIFPLLDKLKEMNAITYNPFFYGAAGYFLTKQYQNCIKVCDFMITHNLKTRSVLYMEAMAFEKQKKYKLSLAMLDECIGDALSRDAIEYFSSKGEIYEKLHQYHTAMKQYDTAYYIFRAPLMLYKKALVYDGKLKSPSTALHYYDAYLNKRRDSVPTEEIPVIKYVRKRVKTLDEWKSKNR